MLKSSNLVVTIILVCLSISVIGESDIQRTSTGLLGTTDVMVCDLPPEVGPCQAAIPRYYYNSNLGTCEQFIYGGCGGNANNYTSFNLCIEACGNVCQLEPEVGPCDAAIPRYYYNANSSTCELFIYGGCQGNANNYQSFEMCMQTCGDVCQLEPQVGPCQAAIPRYYYNSSLGTCEEFIYGGCGGNGNNYTSFNLCFEACGNGDVCQLEPETGPCQAAIPRYYYNSSSGTCEQFIYGGCGGNGNNYTSFNLCFEACGNGDVCQLEPEVGPCQAAIPRYYYNSSSGTCEQFIYGGCGGNANNYSTFNLCIQACGDVCQLEPDVGPCDAAFTRWYFNSSAGQCEQFVYGGCGGNQNQYLTMAMCMAACGDVCYLPPDPGPCQASIPRFYFDPTTGQCLQFNYGGCQGNANNYTSYTLCMSSCAAPCDMPADPGPCQAAIPRFFYSSVTEQCETFTYGGCGGNENNYSTLTACQAACPCPSTIDDDILYSLNVDVLKDASGHINSRSIVLDSARLVYSATDYINLLPGFSVEKDSRLHVILKGCLDN